MKKTKFRMLAILLCVVLSLCLTMSLVACDKDNGKGFKLDKNAETVDVGGQILLSAVNAPGAIVWSSDNEAVATVAQISSKIDTSAKVVGMSVGTAIITATSGDETATCTVTVTAPETISITRNGSAVSGVIEAKQNDTVQLVATSSKHHDIAWESSDPLIASVSSTGLVTAVAKGGTATITAKCAGSDNNTGSIKASVTVRVGSGISTSYEIQHDETPVSPEKVGKWTQWSEFTNVTNATYEDGVVTIEFQNNGFRWVNVQLRYLPTPEDNIEMGSVYAVSFDADLSFPVGFEKPEGNVTVNGNKITLKAGTGHYTAYYVQGEGLAFEMFMGYQDGTPSGAWDLTDAKIVLSNIHWEKWNQQTLTAPTFNIANNVITINDTNPAGSVKEHSLVLYKANKRVGEVTVKNGEQIDVSKILVSGELEGRLKAIASTPKYKDSPEATSANSTVTVENTHVQYDLEYNAGTPSAGLWAYWTETWVIFNGMYEDGIVTATFSNNQGNWYDTQIKYKSLHANGETYKIKLHINVNGTVTGTGRVTINSQVKNLHAGDNEIELTITEQAGDSVIIVFGVYGESERQEIKAATVTISIEEM